MALISELRKRSWIILVFIALALISFLLMDAFNSNSGLMRGNRDRFADINGMDVTPAMLDAKYSEVLTQYLTQTQQLMNYQQGLFTLDNATEFQLREQAWNDLVQQSLMNRELEAAGLKVTEQEKTDLIYGPDPHPYIKNYYAGLSATGVYDANAFNQYVTFIKNPENQQNNPQAQQAYFDFLMRENLAIKEYTNNKYISMFTKADYVPEWMVKRDFKVKNTRVNFEFVDIAYSTIADSTIEVSDSDLKNYYTKYKNKFKQEQASRIVEYIVFPFIATPADSAEIRTKMAEDLAALATAKSDSAFIAVKSEDPEKITRAYNKRSYFLEGGLDSAIVNNLFTAAPGSVVGPYLKGEYLTASLVKDRKAMVDSADVRHILISTQAGNPDSAKTLADSILTAIRGGADFAALATKYSADAGSAADGGNLGWSTPQTDYVKPFKDFVFGTGVVGKPDLVETLFGYHIIEIKETRGRDEYLLVYHLSRLIEASTATADSIDRVANEFFNTYQTAEGFTTAAQEKGYAIRTSPPFGQNQYEIPGLADSRGIITWAFSANKDEFNYFNTYSNQIVVAYVKATRSEGIAELEEVEEQVKLEVIREKKGEQLSEKLEQALQGKDLSSAAKQVNSSVKTSTNASFGTPYAPGIGLEPEVVGRVMATAQGAATPIIAGNRGVYYAKVNQVTPAPEGGDTQLNRNQLTYGFRSKVSQQSILRSLTEKADITDNRYQFGY